MYRALFHNQLERRTAMVMVFAASSVWGLLWLPLRWLDDAGVTGLWSTLAFLALPMVPFLLWRGRVLLEDRRHLFGYLIAGGLVGAGFSLYCTGLVVGSVIKTTLLFYLTPVWASLLGMALLGERASINRWLANGLGITGCALIMGLWREGISFDATDWLGFLSGICWAGGSVAIRRYPEADFLTVTMMQFVLGSLMTLIAVLLIGTPPPSLVEATAAVPVGLLTAAVFVPTMLIIIRINQYLSPGLIGLLMLSEALFAVVSASLLLGEALASLQWVGAGLIFLTALIVAFDDGVDA